MRTAAVAALVAVTVALGAPPGAAQTPTASLHTEEKVSPLYAQGIARHAGGWILSGRNALARVDGRLRERRQRRNVIPAALLREGYNHVGDIDVVGPCIYAPLEQADYERGTQATARFDATTLRFVDSVSLPQHENSFVTLDPKTMTAFSMDRFDGSELLRYDVRADWAPLPPLPMDATLQHTQGADFAGGAVWISTSDPQNDLYRVDAATGHVDLLGSAGHVPGEGEGVDVTPLRSGALHTLTVDPKLSPVWLGHFELDGVDLPDARRVRGARCRATS